MPATSIPATATKAGESWKPPHSFSPLGQSGRPGIMIAAASAARSTASPAAYHTFTRSPYLCLGRGAVGHEHRERPCFRQQTEEGRTEHEDRGEGWGVPGTGHGVDPHPGGVGSRAIARLV